MHVKTSEGGFPSSKQFVIMNSQRDSFTACIGNFTSLQAAEIAAGRLRSEGIPCQVLNAMLASVLPLTDSWAPIRLIVPANFAAKARQLIGDQE